MACRGLAEGTGGSTVPPGNAAETSSEVTGVTTASVPLFDPPSVYERSSSSPRRACQTSNMFRSFSVG